MLVAGACLDNASPVIGARRRSAARPRIASRWTSVPVATVTVRKALELLSFTRMEKACACLAYLSYLGYIL